MGGKRARLIKAAIDKLNLARNTDHGDDSFFHPSHMTPEGWFYLSDAQCYVENLKYDFLTKEGELFMQSESRTDMSGAIRTFLAIDPDVKLIRTFAGKRPDTVYRKVGNEWLASGR